MPNLSRLVDAHIHLWDLSSSWYPALAGDPVEPASDEHGVGDYSKLIGRNYLLPEYLADAAGWPVDKLVHVTAAGAPPSWVDETAWLQRLRHAHGHLAGIVGWIDLNQSPEDIAAEVSKHQAFPAFRGFRNQEGVDYRSAQVGQVFDVFERMNVIYDLVAHEDQHRGAAEAASRRPAMQFVLEHCGWPRTSDRQTFQAWKVGVTELGRVPNVACKLSGLGMVMHEWTVDDFRPWVLTLIEAFGPSRCVFASNFPVDGLYSSYSRLVEAYLEILDGLSQSDHDLVFAEAAEAIYQV